MDNICHTLAGAALGRAGLRHTTRLASATLMIAANLPDIDVLVFATDTPSVAFRRGWTHGLVAQAVLPVALTGIMTVIARWQQRRGSNPARAGVSVPWLLALSIIGIYSHVLLDYLNNYGVRLLSPVSWRWFYGDTLFIVDVWLWATLGAGVWMARRAGTRRPAVVALLLAAIYISTMLWSARAARDRVSAQWTRTHRQPPAALMVGPQAVTPFTRDVIVDAGDHYESGTFRWSAGEADFSAATVPKNDGAPEVSRARELASVRGFLVWSRFPYWTIERRQDGTYVTVRDMRFGDRFAAGAVIR